jgi:hypothetical protein
MLTTTALLSASIDPNSFTNGATNEYKINFISSTPLGAGDKLEIVFPPEITVAASPTCTGVTSLSTSLTCVVVGQTLTINLAYGAATTVIAGDTLSLKVSGFKNPITT